MTAVGLETLLRRIRLYRTLRQKLKRLMLLLDGKWFEK